MLFNDVNAPLALLILFRSPHLLSLWFQDSMSVSIMVIGSVVEQCVHSDFVLVKFSVSPIYPAFLARSSLLRQMSLKRCHNSTTLSRSSNVSVKVHLIPFVLLCIVSFISQSMIRENKMGKVYNLVLLLY